MCLKNKKTTDNPWESSGLRTINIDAQLEPTDSATMAVAVTGLVIRYWHTSYSVFLISPPPKELTVEGKKKNDKESDTVNTSKEKDLNIKRFQKALGKIGEALEYFFKWPFCYHPMKAKAEMKDFVRKITPKNPPDYLIYFSLFIRIYVIEVVT